MATRAPRNPNALVTERDFQKGVIRLARLLGYSVFHPFLSIRSDPGFPDLLLARPADGRFGGRLLFVELKRVGKDPTEAQRAWLETLSAAGGETYVWRPGDPDDEAIMHLLHAEQRP